MMHGSIGPAMTVRSALSLGGHHWSVEPAWTTNIHHGRWGDLATFVVTFYLIGRREAKGPTKCAA